jgi:hypothetical protein
MIYSASICGFKSAKICEKKRKAISRRVTQIL